MNRKKVISIPALDFTIILAMIRAFADPTAADRLVAINFIAGQVILFTLVSSPRHDIALYIDVALVFVLGAFIATTGVLKLLHILFCNYSGLAR